MANIHDIKRSVTEMSKGELISLMQESRANRREQARNGSKKKKKKSRKKKTRVKQKKDHKSDLEKKFSGMSSNQSKQMLELLKEEMDNEE